MPETITVISTKSKIPKIMKNTELKAKAFKYYIMGLNSKEIAKLLNISFRTVQAYMSTGKWKKRQKPVALRFEVFKLYEIGNTYTQIAEQMNISRASVYIYLKQTRIFKEKQKLRNEKKT